jgi:hypothetical protein
LRKTAEKKTCEKNTPEWTEQKKKKADKEKPSHTKKRTKKVGDGEWNKKPKM